VLSTFSLISCIFNCHTSSFLLEPPIGHENIKLTCGRQRFLIGGLWTVNAFQTAVCGSCKSPCSGTYLTAITVTAKHEDDFLLQMVCRQKKRVSKEPFCYRGFSYLTVSFRQDFHRVWFGGKGRDFFFIFAYDKFRAVTESQHWSTCGAVTYQMAGSKTSSLDRLIQVLRALQHCC